MPSTSAPLRSLTVFEGEHGWFEFYAATHFGEPLPPGDFVAALEIDGWSGRFELPITVEP